MRGEDGGGGGGRPEAESVQTSRCAKQVRQKGEKKVE